MQLQPASFVDRLVWEASRCDGYFVALCCKTSRNRVSNIWPVAKNKEDWLGHFQDLEVCV
jgi:hypothetical protein